MINSSDTAREAVQKYLTQLHNESLSVVSASHYTLMQCYNKFGDNTIDRIIDEHWQNYKKGLTSEYKLLESE